VPSVLIVHDVDSYPTWKVVFDGAAEMRRAAGERRYRLLRRDDDPNCVVHLSEWSSLADARRFFESPELVDVRRRAGVHAPTFLYLDEIERGVLSG